MAAEKTISKGAVVKEPGSTVKNKTGSWRTFRPVVTEKCEGCTICTLFCPEGAIEIKESGGKKRAVIDYDHCKGCLICIGVCPKKAITSEREK
jgi:pyruvate ferredoxin oxidoreductase delta subunit